MKAPKNILQIVHENTSTLDTTLPLLYGLKKHYNDNVNITILFLKLNKKQILRNGNHVDLFCLDQGINQLDLSNFFNPVLKLFFYPILTLIKFSYYDFIPKSNFKYYNPLFIFKNFLYLYPSLRRKINDLFINIFVQGDSILNKLKPDLVLWDLREKIKYVHQNDLYRYFDKNKIPVILLPHSPHDITNVGEFTNFGDYNNGFPEYCKYWIAFPPSRSWTIYPKRKHDFVYFGYPAFDDEWINYNKSLVKTNHSDNLKKIVIPLRMFSSKGIKNDPDEKFLYSYEDTEKFIRIVYNTICKKFSNYQIVFKPHPKTNKFFINQLIKGIGVKNCVVSYDLFFSLLPGANLVVTSFSTTIIMVVFNKVPLLITDSDTQDYVQKWDVLDDIYSSLDVVSIDNLDESIDLLLKSELDDHHIKSFRKYWYSNSIEIGVNKISQILGLKY